MRDHLQGIAGEAAAMIAKYDALVLDIGCNDGTLLNYYPPTYTKFGVDPSDVAQEIRGDITVVQDIFPSSELISILNGRKVDIVTSIAMFYDLEDPASFVRSVRQVLNSDGIWIFEMSYMPAMLELNSYDTICHEHLEYYSFAVIERLLSSNGMKVVRAGFTDINGGSIRCYATHAGTFRFKERAALAAIEDVRRQEFDLELDTDKPYRDFQDRIDRHRAELSSLLKGLKRDGKRIHAYGASTKGNTILQWCTIDNSVLDYASDRNPDKHGAMTIGTDIPIISETESREMHPDYYLVLPWHFRKEFLEREKPTLERGTGFIFPLPEIEVVRR
jgi:SAM-dependent methyltransferase